MVVAETIEVGRAEEHEREGWCEGDERREQAAADAARGVADDGHGVHDRTGRDLAEGDGIEELRVGHPVEAVDGVALHERDDDEAAPVGECPDFACHPDQREHAAAGGRRGRGEEGPEVCAERAGAPEGGDDDFGEAAREQHEDKPRSEGGGCRRAEQRVERPAPARRGPAHTGPDEFRAGPHRDRGHGGARAGSGAEDPCGRRGCEEQRSEAEDEHKSRRDERDAAGDRTRGTGDDTRHAE